MSNVRSMVSRPRMYIGSAMCAVTVNGIVTKGQVTKGLGPS